ncbi:MAG: GDP-L-fucose synthase family protein [Casimicrobiaceae bacterium]
MTPDSRMFVAGHRGLVGSAISRKLRADGYRHQITRPRAELDLENQAMVEAFFETERPQYVFLAAGKVGGIHANDRHPAQFIYSNLVVEANVIHAAWKYRVKKLCFLGSSCIYPKFATQPLQEESLLTGALEPTNESYAVAKIAGIKLCQAYRRQYGFDAISVMPTNLYGPGDNFHPLNAHVLPAMMRRFHEAKLRGDAEVSIWGSGTPRREFLHADDLAAAVVHLMQTYSAPDIVNIGSGTDVTISELAAIVAAAVGYRGRIVCDPSRPDGTPQKLLDISRVLALGWQPTIALADGIRQTYQWFIANQGSLRQ